MNPKQGTPLQSQLTNYEKKLESLLSKIEVQNRYSNRISVVNALNESKFLLVKKQLEELKQMRKLEELNEIHLKNVNSQLNKQIQELREQLQVTASALIEIKRENRILKEKNKKLEAENGKYQNQIMKMKREDLENLTSFKMSVVQHLLQSQVKEYLIKANWKQSVLIDHCRECVVNQNYQNFFSNLQSKLEQKQSDRVVQDKKYSLACPRHSRSLSRKKFQAQSAKPTYRSGKVIPLIGSNDQIEQNIKVHKRVKTLCPVKPNIL